jgi:transcriptional regulator with XRE-family HTH domain
MTRLVPATCRAGRALLDWTQEDLAKAAGVCRSTIREFEKGHHALQRASQDAVLDALARAGVEVMPTGPRGPGVRLVRQARRDE